MTDGQGPAPSSRVVAALLASCQPVGGLAAALVAAPRHKMAGVVAARLSNPTAAGIPEDLRLAAARLLDETRHRAGRLLAELLSVTDVLRRADVRSVALKGPALSAFLFGDPLLRQSRDLDLLIAQPDRSRASLALEAIGYVARPRADGLAREIHLVNDRRQCVVDLHWNVVGAEIAFDLDFEVLWQERQEVQIGCGRVALASTAWLMALSSVYLVKEYPFVELVYLAELEELVGRATGTDLARLAEIAANTGTRRIMAVALELLRRRGVAVPPTPCDGATARLADQVDRALDDSRHLRRRRYWHRLANLLTHAGFRERWRDRLRLAMALPLFLVRTDMDDAARAELEGGPRWMSRLRRLPEVAAALVSPSAGAESRVEAALCDPRGRVRPSAGVELFLLDEAGLLLDKGSRELLALSATGTFLWCALEEGMPMGEILPAYAQAFGRSEELALAELRHALAGWASLGLVERRHAAPPAPLRPAVRTAAHAHGHPVSVVSRRYAVLGTRFDLTFEREADAEAVDEVLGHFRAVDCARTCAVVCAAGGQGHELWIDESATTQFARVKA